MGQGSMDTITWEAAITEEVTRNDVQCPDLNPEAIFKTHILTKTSYPNTVVIGFEKIKSRKKSFEALVQWLGPY